MSVLHPDICIAGGGLSGAALAVALGQSGRRVAVLEAAPREASGGDDRGLALSLSSLRVLRALQLGDEIRRLENPIRRLHVSHQGRFGAVRLDAASHDLESFGSVLRAAALLEMLQRRAGAVPGVEFLAPARVRGARIGAERVELDVQTPDGLRAIRCRLLVAADGSDSTLRALLGISSRHKSYGQTAIVTTVGLARPLGDLACERFTAHGPVALLPMQDDAVAVNCVAENEATAVLALDDRAYIARLDRLIGERQGGILRVGPRRAHAQRQVLTPDRAAPRTLLLGNAACTVHSNAAQGLNLALRDVAGLVEALDDAADPGSPGVLDRFVALRAADRRRVARLTDRLARLFCRDDLPGLLAGDLAMFAAARVPPLQRLIVRAGTGFAGRLPAMIREQRP
jgi:2-octaprenyl-6-methoxyphenol hydroxylase